MAKKQTIKIRKKYGLSGTNNLSLGFPTAQNAETIAFNKDILEAKRLGLDNLKTFNLGTTKGILSKIIGDKKVRITGATIEKAMSKDDSHIITWENLINLPDYLNNPLAIFKSKTAGFVVLTEIINTKNKPIIAPLHIVKKGDYIEVKSLYSRKNDSTYKKWTEQNLLLYINKNSKLATRVGTIPTCGDNSLFESKDTKKIITSKKKGENLSLGLPLTDEIRKQAFTDKGKLRKGWYYDEYGLLTDGKEFYISDRYVGEYSAIINRLDLKTQKKRQDLQKMLYDRQERDYETYRKEQGKIIYYLVDKYKIEKRLDFQYNILEAFVRNGELYERISVNRGATNKKVMSFKDLVKIDSKDKYQYVYSLTPKGKEIILEYKNKIDEINAKIEGDRIKIRKKYGLSGTNNLSLGFPTAQLELSTEDFKSMKVKELRAFTLQYYNEHLKGKTATIKKYLKEVVFTTKAGRKIAKGEAMYSAKAVAVKHLQELIENSTYNNFGQRKTTDTKDVLGYLNFKTKFILDGEKKHLRISLVLYKDRKTELKNIEVGSKRKSAKSTQAPVANSKKTGFNRV